MSVSELNPADLQDSFGIALEVKALHIIKWTGPAVHHLLLKNS